MPTSRLQSVIKEYRKQLLAHEAHAEQVLEAAHRQTLQAINPLLDHLYQQIADKQQSGEEIPPSWLYEQHRLQALSQFIQGQINQFGMLAQMQIGQIQHNAVQLGLQSAQALLQSTVPAGVNWSFGVPSPKAIADLVGATQKGSPLADLFNGFGSEAAQGVKNALVTGLSLGYNPRRVAPLVQDALNVSRSRALTISRTSMLDAYRTSQIENYRANSDVVDKMVRVADLSIRTCAACIALNGTEYDLDEDPGFHPNDRCTLVPKTKSWDDILGGLGIDTSNIEDTSITIPSGSDWFNAQPEKVQRQILGNSKYDAWSNGDFELSDIVGRSHSKDWGSSIYEKSLKALVKP